jgi:hypothetical protein
MLDDDARFRDGQAAALVAQHRELADRPDFQERRARGLVAEVDDARLERGVVLVERNQDLLAEARQRVEVERKGHGAIKARSR